MRAVRYHAFGGPDQLRVDDVPVPSPGPDEVLVRVEYAGVNPIDAKVVAGQFPAARPPRIPGLDFAGVVERGGGFAPGTAVVGSGPGFGIVVDGAYAEYVVAPAVCVAPRPAVLPADRAGGLGVVFLTAWHTIHAATTSADEWVLVHGASGGVGQAAIQVAARVAGAKVIAVTSSAERAAQARAHGALHTIDRSRDDVAAEVRKLTEGRGADVIVDVVGGAVFEASVPLLAPRGRLVCVGVSAGAHDRVAFDMAAFYRGNRHILGVNSGTLTRDERGQLLRAVLARVERGDLVLPAVEVLPLADAAAAHQRMSSPDGAHGKLVLAV